MAFVTSFEAPNSYGWGFLFALGLIAPAEYPEAPVPS